MLDLNNFFFTNQFIPHGHCYLWKPGLVWLHVVSDSLIALTYYSIPIMLVYFVRRRRDVPFDWIILMFGTFIVACGTTHVMEVWTLWHPTYWLSGFFKVITAFASLCTAMLLVPLIPKALALPSSTQLQAAIAALKNEITERQQTQKALLESQTRLKLINSISTSMMLGMPAEQIIERTVKQISENFNTFRVAYSTLNEQGNLTVIHSIEPQGMPQQKGLVIDLTTVPEYLNALRTNKPIIVEDFAHDVRLASLFDVMNAYGVQAQLNVPFHYPNNLIGLLCFDSPESRKWSEHEIATLIGIAQYLSILIKHAYAQQERQRTESALLESESKLSLALEAAHMGTWDWNILSGKVTYFMNTEANFGLAPGSFDGTYNSLLTSVHPEDHELVTQALRCTVESGADYDIEFRVIWPDGTVHWVASKGQVYCDKTGSLPVRMIGINMDITERKRAEEEIKTSLQEKEVLLKEVHHRVKNNLQVIDSLFRHQCRHAKDQQTTEILKECQNRVNSMALLHEKLYQSKNLSKIDFAGYMRSLLASLYDSYSINAHNTSLTIKIPQTFLDVETALPCGLIVNELVSNSLKHAFRANKPGEIKITFNSDEDYFFLLSVKDDGVGLPENFDLNKIQSLGLKLVTSLVRQLGGFIEINRSGGTEFQITFTKQKNDVRQGSRS